MHILYDLIIILSISAVALYISSRLNLPSIIAFLIAGILVGPYGIELISTVEEVNEMAEIGILLLLFTIGIEFSLEKLIESWRYVLIGGGLQVLISIGIFYLGASLFELSFNQALFIGMLMALSSTAIVLQIFQEKGWMNTLFGKSSVSILIFQDIIIIPMMLLAPYLTSGGPSDSASGSNLLLGVFMIIIVLYAARKIVPILLRRIIHTHNQELFLISILVICFATAFITNQLGLKLALGAFLAGLIISESEYSFEALKNVMPFKKIFTAIFFISVGMLLNLSFVGENMLLILAFSAVVMLIKFIIIVPVSYSLKVGLRNAIISGLVLCQVGEFAFILSKVGLESSLLSEFNYQMFLAISIVSMIASTLIISLSPQISQSLVDVRFLQPIFSRFERKDCLPKTCTLIDHFVIIGFGPGGKRIAKYLADQNKALAVIELNERNISQNDHQLAEVIIGDATDLDVLKRAAIENAKQVIIAVPDVATAELITTKVRKQNHNANIVVRTRYAAEADELHKLGANHVVPEEVSVAERITSMFATT